MAAWRRRAKTRYSGAVIRRSRGPNRPSSERFVMRLTPPRFVVFLVAMILAILSIGSHYTHIPTIGRFVVSHQYWMLVAAFALLAAGVIFPGL
jgi:hypothetical protein